MCENRFWDDIVGVGGSESGKFLECLKLCNTISKVVDQKGPPTVGRPGHIGVDGYQGGKAFWNK